MLVWFFQFDFFFWNDGIENLVACKHSLAEKWITIILFVEMNGPFQSRYIALKHEFVN